MAQDIGDTCLKTSATRVAGHRRQVRRPDRRPAVSGDGRCIYSRRDGPAMSEARLVITALFVEGQTPAQRSCLGPSTFPGSVRLRALCRIGSFSFSDRDRPDAFSTIPEVVPSGPWPRDVNERRDARRSQHRGNARLQSRATRRQTGVTSFSSWAPLERTWIELRQGEETLDVLPAARSEHCRLVLVASKAPSGREPTRAEQRTW